MRLTTRQLNRSTLSRQMLLAREPLPLVEAVERVVALQAQEPASPYISIWNRVGGFDPATLDRAFADGDIVKASLMRMTLHAVSSRDYTMFHEAVLPALRGSRLYDRRFTDTGMSIEEADAMLAPLIDFAAEPRNRVEIERMLSERMGGKPPGRLWWALRTYAPLVHAPMGGKWSFGRNQGFLTAPNVPDRMSREASLQGLAHRYLAGFGPASRHDFGRFTLIAQATIKPVFAAMDYLERREGPDGIDLYDVPGAIIPDEDTPAPPHLMAMWDSVLLAHADRSRILPEEYRKVVIRSNGDVLPALLVDGMVAGVWRHRGDAIEATAFHPLTEENWDGLADEAKVLLKLLDGRDDAVYRRYARWWEKLPEGETRLLGR